MMVSTRKMLEYLGLVASSFAGNYLASNGKRNPYFNFPKDLAASLTTTAATQATTMSSREIAELCDKRHDNVLRDIEKMLAEITDLKTEASDLLSSYKDTTGRLLKEYRLPKDLTVTLITGYRADLRYKVVKRLEELETQTKPQAPAVPNFMDPVQAAEAWIAAYKAQQIAQQKVEELQPLAIVGARAASHDHSLNRFMRTLAGVCREHIRPAPDRF